MNCRNARQVWFAFALAVLCFCPAVAGAQPWPPCMTRYYREKPPACLDDVLTHLRQKPPSSGYEPSTIIGFLAWIFRSSPQQRDRILKAESTDYVKSVLLLSLYRAGLPEDAQKFAAANNLSALSEKLRGMRLVALDAVKPSSVLEDNELLVGAYMASGDTALVQRVLENYSSADDAMAGDGLRIGLMMSKFGADLAPKGRNPVTTQVACAKYRCKEDEMKLRRVWTLATAMWSLRSLSGQDDRIKKTLADFFARDARLKNLFDIEQAAFGNYMTAVMYVTVFKAENTTEVYAAMEKSASNYEGLGSAKEAFAPMMKLRK